jgi:hypothetical protein
VRLQSSRDERCIFRRVPADALTNYVRRTALAVQDEPFIPFFAPRLKEPSLFHAASNARRANQTIYQPASSIKSLLHHTAYGGLLALSAYSGRHFVLTPAREPRSCTTVQVVPLLDDKAVLATVVAKLLNPLLLPPEHFEASCRAQGNCLGASLIVALETERRVLRLIPTK